MKYPKPWEAGSPAGKPYVASYREGAHDGQIQLATYVNRPGTPDHTRLVRTWLTVAEAKRVRDELTHHIGMMERREALEAKCLHDAATVPGFDPARDGALAPVR